MEGTQAQTRRGRDIENGETVLNALAIDAV
jgi:hypothetical protein